MAIIIVELSKSSIHSGCTEYARENFLGGHSQPLCGYYVEPPISITCVRVLCWQYNPPYAPPFKNTISANSVMSREI
jgi:hypothetical protein